MKSRNKTIIFLSLILFSAGVIYWINQPKKRAVLVYTTNSACELMLQATIPHFTEETGIEVSYVCPGGSGAVVNKVIAQKDNPSADVFIASLPSMLGAKQENAIEHYISPEAANYQSYFKDEDGYFCGWWAFHTVLVYNPRFCDPPETFQDLLDPKWKGKLAYPDPTTSGDGLRFIAVIIETMGENEGFEFLKKLEVNMARHDSIAIGQFIDKGELWCQVFNDAAVISESMMEQITDQYMCVTEEGSIAGYVAVAITKNAPNLDEAKLLIDYMLSEGGQIDTTAGFGFPCRSGMGDAIPEELKLFWAPFLDAPVIELNWQELADNMERWKTRWLEEVQPVGG